MVKLKEETLKDNLISLKDEIMKIHYGDETELKRVIDKAMLYVKAINPDTELISEMDRNHFYGYVLDDEVEATKNWENGKKIVCNAIDLIIEEAEINERPIEEKVIKKEMGNVNLRKIFISHKSEDSMLIDGFVELLEALGLNHEHIIYTSKDGYGIPFGENIYDYLKATLNDETMMIFMLSNNYYKSVACLNEMGASWVNSTQSFAFMLPLFSYQEIEGSIDPMGIASQLNNRHKLTELKNFITEKFELTRIRDEIWEEKREKFITDYNNKLTIYYSNNNPYRVRFYEFDEINKTLLYRVLNDSDNKVKFRNIELYFEVNGSEEVVKITDDKIFLPRENCIRVHELDEDIFERLSWGVSTRSSCNFKKL